MGWITNAIPLLGLTVILSDRKLSFTCVLRCHTSSPKGEGQNLWFSKSVVGAKLRSSLLSNPNVHGLLIPGHLPITALPRRLYLSSYRTNCIYASYPNSQFTLKTVRYLEGDLAITRIQLHQITEEWKTTVILIFILFWWLVENIKTDKPLDSIVQYMSMVLLRLFLNVSTCLLSFTSINK